METRKTVKDILKIILESYEYQGHKYVDTTFKMFVHPFIIMQLLAWNNNAAHIDENNILICSDWNNIPEDILREIRMALFTSYRSIINDKIDFDEKQQCYIIKTGEASAIVEEPGLISIPEPEIAKKLGSNYKKNIFPKK